MGTPMALTPYSIIYTKCARPSTHKEREEKLVLPWEKKKEEMKKKKVFFLIFLIVVVIIGIYNNLLFI
jgi:hypothetical protein